MNDKYMIVLTGTGINIRFQLQNRLIYLLIWSFLMSDTECSMAYYLPSAKYMND